MHFLPDLTSTDNPGVMHMADDRTKSGTCRLVTAAFGLMFAGIAVAIVLVAERSVGALLAALVIGFLGVDAVVCAWRNTLSLLSRIGPLP